MFEMTDMIATGESQSESINLNLETVQDMTTGESPP